MKFSFPQNLCCKPHRFWAGSKNLSVQRACGQDAVHKVCCNASAAKQKLIVFDKGKLTEDKIYKQQLSESNSVNFIKKRSPYKKTLFKPCRYFSGIAPVM
jgi:hypothetical protein